MKINKKSYFIYALSSIFLITGCSKDEESINLEEEILFSSANSSFATPINGNIYTIQSASNGRTLDIENRSNSNGANLQVWGTNTNTSSTHRQWEVINTDNGYVRLRGIDSGKSLEVSGGSNSTGANVQQWAYRGTTHQQWEILSVGNGYFRLKNRDSGKSLRVSGSRNGSNVDQASYDQSDNQKWFFTQVGGSASDEPTPVSNTPTNESTDNSFISTNDGTFNLNDYQIESSSHLSSSTSTSTTSWSYDESDIFGSEWYYISGNCLLYTSPSPRD